MCGSVVCEHHRIPQVFFPEKNPSDFVENFPEIPGSQFAVFSPNVLFNIYNDMDNYIYRYIVSKRIKDE